MAGCTSLQRLDLTHNAIGSTDGDSGGAGSLSDFAAGIASSPGLESLLLGHNQLGSPGVQALAAALRQGAKALRLLNLRYGRCGRCGA